MVHHGDSHGRTSSVPWVLFGLLFIVGAAVLVLSLADTPSPGLPPQSLALFHNEPAAWLGTAGVLVALIGALVTLAMSRSRDRRAGDRAEADINRLEEEVRDLEKQVQVRDERLRDLGAARDEIERKLQDRDFAAADLEARNAALEHGRRELELRIRELELRVGELELEREREKQRHLQQA